MTERPFFRTDLVSRPLDDGGQRFVEVIDPDSGNSFRFYEIEYAIACAMDGARDVTGLVEWARIELGLEPSPDELQIVIGTLADLGYLESAEPLAALGPPRVAAPAPAPMAAPRPPRSVVPPMPAPPMAAAASGDDLDLGAAGKSPMERRPSPAPPAGTEGRDVELGFAGRSELARPEPAKLKSSELELGAAGNVGLPDVESVEPSLHERPTSRAPALAREAFDGSDVSTDLSDHIPVLASDVKEAVRASRIMPAVRPEDVPADIGAESTAVAPEERRGAAQGAGGSERRDRGRPPQEAHNRTILGVPAPSLPPAAAQGAGSGKGHVTIPKQPPPAAAAPPHASRPGGEAGRHATPLPSPPAAISERLSPGAAADAGRNRPGPMASDVHPSAPQPRRSLVPILLVLVVLALAGAATAYWWFELREKSPGEAGQTPVGEVSSESPSAPPAERITATLEAGSGAEESVTAPRAGRVGWIAETGSDVAEGAPVVKLDGFQMRERNLQVAEESQRRYQERLDQATSKDDKAGMKRAEADVKRKQNDIERIRAELAGYVVSAPIAGVVEPVVELKAAVAEGEPVARIATHAGPKATFTVPAGRTFAAGDQLAVTSVADPDLRATCAVDAVEGSSVTVTCPSDSGLAAGSAVALE